MVLGADDFRLRCVVCTTVHMINLIVVAYRPFVEILL